MSIAKRYIRPEEAATELDCSKRTIYRLIEEGELVAFSIRKNGGVRIPLDAIERFVQKRIQIFQAENGIVPPDDK